MYQTNPLELRPLPQIAAAYVLAPTAGLSALWLIWIVPNSPWLSALTIWGTIIIIGGALCLAVELVIVTPLLLGYRRYRWMWLNGWSAVAIAFAVGAVFALGWDIYSALHQYPGYSESGQYGVACFVNGMRTEAGWRLWRGQLAPSAAASGMVGAISALVFRLVAIRTGRTSGATLAKGS